MKIRNGFVSNSSSSSFIIIGKELDIRQVNIKIVNEKQIVAVGDDLNEGQDIFQIISIEQLAFLKAMENLENSKAFRIFDAYLYDTGDYEGDVEVKKLPSSGKLRWIKGEKDYCSSESLSVLQSRYDQDGQISKVMERYLRAKKIKNIEKKLM